MMPTSATLVEPMSNVATKPVARWNALMVRRRENVDVPSNSLTAVLLLMGYSFLRYQRLSGSPQERPSRTIRASKSVITTNDHCSLHAHFYFCTGSFHTTRMKHLLKERNAAKKPAQMWFASASPWALGNLDLFESFEWRLETLEAQCRCQYPFILNVAICQGKAAWSVPRWKSPRILLWAHMSSLHLRHC